MSSDSSVEVFRSTQAGQIKRVEIRIVGGNIRINALKTQTVTVKALGDVATLGAKAAVEGDVLHITSSSALRYFVQKSRIDLVLDVPEDTGVFIKVFGADIVINGGTGPLEVRGFAGAIEGTTYSKDVKVNFTVGGNDLVQAAGGDGRS
ncbi:hypothetical protein FH608_011535 [Nonomuraea phyllanthi]|uniref:Uncharacterized protein n=1 Tax=Nonomuraea phyllanthi TaxID=2219224 RepID=A0A5C4WS62_9ACTN|nr:hypothetical protein [Nonomuraea phyllanthi]KAB8196078.1 hypothetical protein FH608_011535 [Nonomuraea phyllanthi]QFY07537.1 hypothetical protein GBF35_13355 [Nonomuraea phyllanthi]